MTFGRSLLLALVSALILFFSGLWLGAQHRVCTYAYSQAGWVPVCSNSFEQQIGN